jgi:ABC-type transport system involved in cytochrome bd biosynthesis fused ATPase/permease subunit
MDTEEKQQRLQLENRIRMVCIAGLVVFGLVVLFLAGRSSGSEAAKTACIGLLSFAAAVYLAMKVQRSKQRPPTKPTA